MSLLLVLLLACEPPVGSDSEGASDAYAFEVEEPAPEPALWFDEPWTLQTPSGPGPEIHPSDHLVEVPCPDLDIESLEADADALTRLAEATLRRRAASFPDRSGPGLLGSVSPEWMDEALRRVAAGDANDPALWAEAFRCIAWLPDHAAAARRNVQLSHEQVRVTRYLAWRVQGRDEPVDPYTTALYAVPDDDADSQLRNRFTRRQVLAGVYEDGGAASGRAKPLVWLERDDVHQALMQGSIVVARPDGTERTYNVHRHNGHPWDSRASNPESQSRYWYFREVPGVLGFSGEDRGVVESGVIVAGDVPNLGLGAPMLLHWRDGDEERGRLVLLADTGGAFQPNLFQLDWLVGTFSDRAAFEAAARAVPERVHAVFLIPREP